MLRGPQARAAALDRVGAIQAQAAERNGQVWGAMAQNLGELATHRPQQILEGRAAAQREDATALALDRAHREVGADRMAAAAMAGDQLPAGVVGPRQPSFIRKEGDVSVFDTDALSQHFAAAGYGDQMARLLKDVETVNTAHRTDAQARAAATLAQQNVIARSAGLALKSIDAGLD